MQLYCLHGFLRTEHISECEDQALQGKSEERGFVLGRGDDARKTRGRTTGEIGDKNPQEEMLGGKSPKRGGERWDEVKGRTVTKHKRNQAPKSKNFWICM